MFEVLLRGRMAGIDFQRLLELLRCLGRPPLLCQSCAQRVVQFRIVWQMNQGLLQIRHGLRNSAGSEEHRSEIGLGFREIGS